MVRNADQVKEYAQKRVVKLEAKKEALTAVLRSFGGRPCSAMEQVTAQNVLRQIRSTNQTLKRWYKELDKVRPT